MTSHLPTITLIYAPWMDNAACTKVDPDVMFPDHDDAQIEAAKHVCRPCTVRDQCLEYAYATDDRHGVLGGTTADERAALRRKAARIARPANITVPDHGEPRYQQGCRCDVCLAVHAERARAWRRDKKGRAS